MKRILASAFLMGLALVLLVPAPAASAATPSWTDKDRLYVKMVRQQAPAFKYISAKDLIGSAKLSCEVMRENGSSPLELVEVAIDSGLTQRQAIALIAGAVVFYCPEQDEDY